MICLNTMELIQFFKFNTLIKTLSLYNNISTFVQVGAHDGEMHDPIRKFILANNWSGLLIEPQKDMLEKCKKSYKNKENLIFINCAVHPYKKNIELFKVNNAKDYSHTGWASIMPDRFVDTKYENDYSIVNVKAKNLMDIIKENNFNSIDILQIDTEGFDGEVIKMFDFSNYTPLLIQYEHVLLSMSDHKTINNQLDLLGYYSIIKKNDTILVKKSLISLLFITSYIYMRILSSIKSRFNNLYNKF